MIEKCPNTKGIVILGINEDHKIAMLFNPSCKSWDCPVCGPKNAENWAWAGMTGAYKLLDDSPMVFCTVTSRPYASVNQSLYFFKQNWPKLRKRITVKNSAKFEYMLIPERHKTGVLHAHFVANISITKRWLKDNAFECGFGYQAKVDPVDHAPGVAAYMTKYMAKSMTFTQWPDKFRRVRRSQNWPMPAQPEPLPGWAWTPRQFIEDAELQDLLERQFAIHDRR